MQEWIKMDIYSEVPRRVRKPLLDITGKNVRDATKFLRWRDRKQVRGLLNSISENASGVNVYTEMFWREEDYQTISFVFVEQKEEELRGLSFPFKFGDFYHSAFYTPLSIAKLNFTSCNVYREGVLRGSRNLDDTDEYMVYLREITNFEEDSSSPLEFQFILTPADPITLFGNIRSDISLWAMRKAYFEKEYVDKDLVRASD
jgi:hypothetical protein